jgi:hypothetical protein
VTYRKGRDAAAGADGNANHCRPITGDDGTEHHATGVYPWGVAGTVKQTDICGPSMLKRLGQTMDCAREVLCAARLFDSAEPNPARLKDLRVRMQRLVFGLRPVGDEHVKRRARPELRHDLEPASMLIEGFKELPDEGGQAAQRADLQKYIERVEQGHADTLSGAYVILGRARAGLNRCL